MFQKQKKYFFIKKPKISMFLLILFVSGFLFLYSGIRVVNAVAPGVLTVDNTAAAQRAAAGTEKKGWDRFVEAMKKAGSKAFGSALKNALNTIAYDTATWIGSGSKGQKPMFFAEGWDAYLTNVADNAAGTFLEELGRNSFANFNLCEPKLDIQLTIALGLTQYKRPAPPACTFSTMAKNWQSEMDRWKDMDKEDFLKDFQDMWDPVSNDVGASLSLSTKMFEKIKADTYDAEKDREETGGWLEFGSVSGIREGMPGNAKGQQELSNKLMSDNFAVWTGDALVDAGNIFLNQLAITYFQRKMREWFSADKGPSTTPDGGGGVTNAERQASSGGATAMKAKLKGIIQPDFTTRGDYDILAELSICPNPAKAGPMDCVINDQFSQAVINKLTVAEAIEQGYLNPGGIFGFQNKVEPSYTEAYPYRSMIILRKFRILPVGWEVAAQYIYENENANAYSLGDLIGCFDAGDSYTGGLDDQSWCAGLVDPNWVLKAPLNYCRRSGPGSEIISSSVAGDGNNSQLMVSRNEDYCADEQSCIDENDDGSCQFYGYCVEEKRKWRFDGDSCEANFNTCQTFSSQGGGTVSYLKNTLDYSSCSMDNVGCQEYCADYDFGDGSWSCAETLGNKIYFDKDVEECDQENEGCHEFIRTKSGLGTNLIVNSSFENSINGSIWSGVGEQIMDGRDGTMGLKLNSNVDKYIEVGPSGYSISGRAYTLSFYAKNCGISGEFGMGTNLESKVEPFSTDSDWNRYQASYIYPDYYTDNKVRVIIRSFDTATCVIDAVKLENSKTATAYNDYGNSGLVYEKLLPSYLKNSCYESGSDFRFKSSAPAECNNFARQCNQDEVGCEMFTSVRDKTSIPAQVVEENYCPSECAGYDSYVQSGTIFDSMREAYFIPKSAKSCSAEAMGCDEFTNLDEVANGGEGLEYYTYLRQCVKSSDSSCFEFYTWEGSEEAGYQLKVFQLKADGNEPFVTEDDYSQCNKTIYDLSESDPSYNEDCREFYSKNGEVSYHLYTRTVTCSDDCHTYRRTAVNSDQAILNSFRCSAANGQWINGVCAVCKNNGHWDAQQGACLYDAIPGEGVVCSAAQNGCRKYVGNFGNNTKTVLNYYFDGSTQGWSGVGATNIEPNAESLFIPGNSLYITNGEYSASANIGNLIQTNKSYTLNFIAKANTATKITSISFINGLNEKDVFASVGLRNNWRSYKVSLANVNNRVDANERLVIAANGSFYIDNIELVEVMDQYYLIKDSWTTPESCDQNVSGNPSPLFMLGCAEYRDRDNTTHYLHSFNNLCQESAVGCELLIDTNNYSDYNAKTFNEGDASEIVVPADSFVYAVYDRAKECPQADKGCQKMGSAYQYEGNYFYNDVYLNNDPDRYNNFLCYKNEVGCQEWAGDSLSYFKDPGDQVCEWRLAWQGDWGWYKKKIKRCDDNKDGSGEGDICTANKDCDSSVECKPESGDTPCPTKANRTFGTGNEKIFQPSADGENRNWAGICAVEDSGCTEYIDPISGFSTNIIANADFVIDNLNNTTGTEGADGKADGWNNQTVDLYPNTLYSLSVKGNNTVSISAETLVFYGLDQKNKLTLSGSGSISVASGGAKKSKLFYTSDSHTLVRATVSVSNYSTGNGSNKVVGLREAVVDYQVKEKLDKASCNGLVDFEAGCVLFNERNYSGSSLSGLIWDADLTINDQNGIAPVSGGEAQRDANVILKVRPDRKCDKWMACTAETIGMVDGDSAPVCIDVGLCDRIDANGGCIRFVDNKKINETYDPTLIVSSEKFLNRSGYSKVGLAYNPDKTLSYYPNNLYPFGFMESIGEVISITNSGFEFARDEDRQSFNSGTGEMGSEGIYGDYGDPDWPEYWTAVYDCDEECLPEVVDDPAEAAKADICFTESNFSCEIYAPEGKNFLRLTANNFGYSRIKSSASTALSSQEYVFSLYMDTSRLTAGQTVAAVKQLNASGAWVQSNYINLESMKDWEFKMKKFKTRADTKTIEIELYLSGYGESSEPYGYAYFDDIKIRPALEVSDLTPQHNTDDNYWNIGQTCRLYPESDSLSCDYYKGSTSVYDKGVRYKGWFGHCLEYDRYPGSSETCLLWWPAPHTTNKVNEWCGDNKVTGDEDCECESDLTSTSANVVLTCSLRGIDSPSVLGSNIGHQYECTNCMFTEGWCGDNALQKNMGEECDWNEATEINQKEDPNLDDPKLNTNVKDFSCAYAPSEEPAKDPFGNEPPGSGYSRYSSYKGKYLYSRDGDLGCKKSGDEKCTFDFGACESRLVNNTHTREDCISAGGQVVNKLGHVVIDYNNNIVLGEISMDGDNDGADDYYPYFCKFSKPPACVTSNNTCLNNCENSGKSAQDCAVAYNTCVDSITTPQRTCTDIKNAAGAVIKTAAQVLADCNSCVDNCKSDCTENCESDDACIEANCATACATCTENSSYTSAVAVCETTYSSCNSCVENCDSVYESCGGSTSSCPGDWKQYKEWSTTSNRYCYGGGTCYGQGEGGRTISDISLGTAVTMSLFDVICAKSCSGAADCSTGYHNPFADKAQETCTYKTEDGKKKNHGITYPSCHTHSYTCAAKITEIGCY